MFPGHGHCPPWLRQGPYLQRSPERPASQGAAFSVLCPLGSHPPPKAPRPMPQATAGPAHPLEGVSAPGPPCTLHGQSFQGFHLAQGGENSPAGCRAQEGRDQAEVMSAWPQPPALAGGRSSQCGPGLAHLLGSQFWAHKSTSWCVPSASYSLASLANAQAGGPQPHPRGLRRLQQMPEPQCPVVATRRGVSVCDCSTLPACLAFTHCRCVCATTSPPGTQALDKGTCEVTAPGPSPVCSLPGTGLGTWAARCQASSWPLDMYGTIHSGRTGPRTARGGAEGPCHPLVCTFLRAGSPCTTSIMFSEPSVTPKRWRGVC